MKGLLRKDLYMIWNYGRMLLVMCLAFMIGAAFMDEDNFFFVIYPVLFAGVLPVTLISYEERFGWNSYCDTMPLSRRTIVSARYLTTLLSFLVIYVLTLALRYVGGLLTGRPHEVRELAALLPFFGLAAPAFMLPLTLRFGVEKARIAYYILIGVIVGLGLFLFQSSADLSREIGGVGLWTVLLIAVAAFALSWLLSIRLYEKREL